LIDLELGRRDCTVGTLVKLASALRILPGQLLDSAPPSQAPRLNRFERDALARAIITGSAPAAARLERVARDLRPLFRPALQAAGCWPSEGRRVPVRRRKYRLEAVYSEKFLNDVAERVQRLLPSFLRDEHDEEGH
jgi:hypothetical protein